MLNMYLSSKVKPHGIVLDLIAESLRFDREYFSSKNEYDNLSTIKETFKAKGIYENEYIRVIEKAQRLNVSSKDLDMLIDNYVYKNNK
jgi:hypothetical protein